MSIRFKTTLGIMPVRRGLCPEGGPVRSAWPEFGSIPVPCQVVAAEVQGLVVEEDQLLVQRAVAPVMTRTSAFSRCWAVS
jgi:hypothetical protein